MRHSLDPKVDPRAHIFPVNDVFETADGKRLTLGILEEHFWNNFVSIVPELGVEEFSSDEKRRQNGDALSRLLEKTMKTRTAAEWMRLLEENDVPVDLCVTPGEAMHNPQLEERRAVSNGFALFPVWANGARGGSIRRGVPKNGEHSREILVELGFDDADIAALRKTVRARAEGGGMASEGRRIVWPIVLIVVGVLFLASNLGYLHWGAAAQLPRHLVAGDPDRHRRRAADPAHEVGMDFSLSDEQQRIREAIAKLCTRFPDEYWLKRDNEGGFPADFHQAMAQDGWLGIAMPEEFGGAGLGIQEAAVMMQAIAESGAGFSGASAVHMNIFGLNPVVVFGNEEQKTTHAAAADQGQAPRLLRGHRARYRPQHAARSR